MSSRYKYHNFSADEYKAYAFLSEWFTTQKGRIAVMALLWKKRATDTRIFNDISTKCPGDAVCVEMKVIRRLDK